MPWVFKSLHELKVFLAQCAYFFFRLACIIVQRLIHRFNGVAYHRQKVMDGEDKTGLVAEVCRVNWVLPHVVMSVQDHYHFALWHSKFVTLDYLLKPEVTLYAVDDKTALFLECPPGIDLFNTVNFTFFFIAQRDKCINAIILPLEELKRLGKQIGSPKCKVAWIMHHGRCRSTVLAQAMNPIPGCKAISETSFLSRNLAIVDIEGKIPLDEYMVSDRFFDIGEAAIRFMLKDFPEDCQVVWKCVSIFDLSLVPLISKRFPQHKIISMHRDGLNASKSFYKPYSEHVLLLLASFMLNYRIPGFVSNLVLGPVLYIYTSGMRHEFKDFWQTGTVGVFQLFYIRWLTFILRFQQLESHIKDLLCLVHEDFDIDAKATFTKVYEFLGIPLTHLPLSLDAISRDSQKGTLLDRSIMATKPGWQRNEETVRNCNRLLKEYKLPSFDQKFRFGDNREILVFT